ncbi:hypothetical protein EJ04DRAFT_511062 [Polyplosphaeria fusca]|uniref:Uncharacterized protein n=1 Tax=Polyplosphaeria fusca TaxID=682080 RepID=A0A9P4R0K7_9PLEO|nr:hypothetical protein EJ04DRAFT_511062 [Polyplosphaeria fusca]
MASALRKIPGALWISASRPITRASGAPRAHFQLARHIVWPNQRRNSPSGIRSFHEGSGGSGSSGQNWDGLVYSMMDNLQIKAKHGPECFYRDEDEDEEEDEGEGEGEGESEGEGEKEKDKEKEKKKKKKKRDMRDEVPLRLNRPWCRHTAESLDARLKYLGADMDHTEEHRNLKKLVKLLHRLSDYEEDSPKLDFDEYREIWMTGKTAFTSEMDFPITMFSVAEKSELTRIYAAAGAVYRVAAVNAALLRLRPQKESSTEGSMDEEESRELKQLALDLYGAILDAKDFFPVKKWLTIEEDVRVLAAIEQIRSESRKRGSGAF